MQRARPVAVETGPVTLRSNATSIHGPAVINVDETGTVTAANQEAAELTGYDVSELIGLGVEQLVPQGLKKQRARRRGQLARNLRSSAMNSGKRLVLRTKQGFGVPVTIGIHALERTNEVRYVIEKTEPSVEAPLVDSVRSIILNLNQTNSTESSPKQITEFATRELSKLFDDKLVVYWEYEQANGTCMATQKFLNGRNQEFSTTLADTSAESQIGRAIQTLSDIDVRNGRNGDTLSLPHEMVSNGYSGGAAAIVHARYAPAGVITIYSRSDKDACSDQDLRVLRQIADAVGFSLSRHSAESSLRQELVFQEILTRLGQVISHTTYLRDRFDEVAEIVGEVIGHDRMVIASYDRTEKSVVDILIAGQAIGDEHSTSTPIEGDSNLEDLIFRGESIIRNLSKPSQASAISRREAVRYQAGLKSLMAVPIKWRSEVIGILNFRSKTEGAYGPVELSLAIRIADYLAGAIVSSNLVDEIEEQRKVQTFLARIGRVVSENLDLKILYRHLADELHEVVPFERIWFARWRPERSTIDFVQGSDAPGIEVGTEFDTVRNAQSLVFGESITMDGDLMPFEKILVELGLQTRIQLCIGTTESPLGLISLARESRLGFTRSEETLLRQVADQIAPAISNAIGHETILQLLQELSESETRYRDLFNNAPDIIISADAETGLIVDYNDAAIRILGYTDEELLKLHVSELYHPDSNATARFVSGQFRDTGRVAGVRAQFVRNDGTIINVSIDQYAVRDSTGKTIRSISTIRDITALLKAESDAQESFRLDSDNRELVRINEARSEFLSRVSHELRTPLTALLAFGHILSKNSGGSMSPQQLEQLRMIRNNGWKLEESIKDLLDVSRAELGTYQNENQDFDLNVTLQRVLSLASSIFEQNGQNLFIELCTEPIWIDGDEKRMSQVISNLLTNASKYSPEGGDIEIRLFEVPGGVQLQVHDNGIGIRKADIKNLFTPFFRVDNEQTRKVGGTGLGLVIVRTIVELHGGNVSIKSKVGVGTTVTVFLPTIDPKYATGENYEIDQRSA